MRRKWVFAFVALVLVGALFGALPAPRALAATKTWDGGAGTNKWSDAANWSPDGIPTTGDVVTLDNSYISGSYTVVIDGSVSVAQVIDKLAVGYAGNLNTITLNITSANTVASVITLQSAAADNIQLVIDQGGVINNQSGASSGRAILFSGTTKIWQMNNDALYLHNSGTGAPRPSSSQNVWQFSGTSTFEYKVPGTSNYSIVASGVTYQNLKLSAGGATATYSNSGGSAFTINGDFTLGSNVTFNPGLTATTTFRGNVTNGGTWTTHATGPIVFDGNTTLGGTSVTTFNAGFTVNTGKSLTLAQNAQSAAAKTVTVNGTLDANGNTLTVSGTLVNNGTLKQTLPVTGSGSVGFFNTGSYGGVLLDAAGGGDLGSTVVTIRGNQTKCDTNDTSVRRCFAIGPTNNSSLNAIVTLYFGSGEIGTQTCGSLDIYHWTGSPGSWSAAGTVAARDCASDPRSVQVTGVSSFSPVVLSSNTSPVSGPNAVTLRTLTAAPAPFSPLAVAPILGLIALAGLAVYRRRRTARR